jgi:hypothetical protein
MAQYNVSGIVYCRETVSNLAIAVTNSGGTSTSTIENIIAPPTLATGKITCSDSSTTVTGAQTTFKSQFKEGEYLYAYDAQGAPELIGKIATISNDTTITLTEEALFTRTLKPAGSSEIMLRGTESILIRIPVVVSARNSNGVVTQAFIPNFNEWRLPNNTQGLNGFNNPSSSNLVRYSNPGNLLSVDSTPTDENNIPFSITTLNQFSNGSSVDVVWNTGNIPNYIWARLNPYGDNGIEMAQSTMFYLFTKTTFNNGLTATNNFSKRTLETSGYTLY